MASRQLLTLSTLFTLSLSQAVTPAPTCANPDAVCSTYGIDFQNGGTYFQDTGSTDPFTFVSQFSGCAPDIAQNILVDPNGNQYLCSNTSLTPDFTSQLSTCQEPKSSLFSGQWSILIISNNGGCNPLAAQRSFQLNAGPATTVTETPTVTLTSSFTPTTTATTTQTAQVTVLQGSAATASLTTQTTTLATQTLVDSSAAVSSHVLAISTASCTIPQRASNADPWAHIAPTIVPGAMRVFSAARQNLRRDTTLQTRAPTRLIERDAKANRNGKRAPDQSITTITETDTALFSTTTHLITASPSITSWTTVYATSTVTADPAPAAVQADAAQPIGQQIVMETASPIETRTTPIWTVPTVPVTVRPEEARHSCRAQGGHLA